MTGTEPVLSGTVLSGTVLSGTELVVAIGRLRSVVYLTLGRSCDSAQASPWTIVVAIRARSRLSEGKLINA